MPNFVYRNIKPIYRILKNGDIINTETGEFIEIDFDDFYVRLLNVNERWVKVKATSIFANVFLGGRTRNNKLSAAEFYKRKFEQ